ncbi:MAG TPA: quinolinate synthase NadA [Bacillota bacterium]|nr:quinolinate synthase NadA [Bacillota bacterium]HPE38005.1 quinolinate synthase NadA [Bacillota bacterium]
MGSIIDDISTAKKNADAIILAHLYVDGEVQDIADYCGDSYYLSQMAEKSPCKTILFCGVRFMAESAKILSPEKTVLMADTSADCPMAHMVSEEQIREMRKAHDDLCVVCYINSTTEVKALSDVCVTSSNAKTVISKIQNKNILFIPDKNLGSFLAPSFPDKNFYYVDGCCPIHDKMNMNDILNLKARHPSARIATHPECPASIVAISDYVGSTTGILKYAHECPSKELIICTEIGVRHRLLRENPDKVFFFPTTNPICNDMKKINLENVLYALIHQDDPIEVPEEIRLRAKGCLEKMHQLGG